MLPEAKDAEGSDISEEEDHEYLRTPKLSDDEVEEEKMCLIKSNFSKKLSN